MLEGDEHIIVLGEEAFAISVFCDRARKQAATDGIRLGQWPEFVAFADAINELVSRHRTNKLRTNGAPCDGVLLESLQTNTPIKSAEAARAKGVTRRAVQRACEAERLKATRDGHEWQIDPEELVKWKPRTRKVKR